jgi:hypothetical protein
MKNFKEMALNKSQLGVVVRCYLNGHYGEKEYRDWIDYWLKFQSNGYMHQLGDKINGAMFRIAKLEFARDPDQQFDLYQEIRSLVSDNYSHFKDVFMEEFKEWMSETGVPMWDDSDAVRKYWESLS